MQTATESISEVHNENRYVFFGYVERRDDNDWVKCVKHLETVGTPRKEWNEVLKRDLQSKTTD